MDSGFVWWWVGDFWALVNAFGIDSRGESCEG